MEEQEQTIIKKETGNDQGPYLIPASIVVAGLLIAGAVMYAGMGSKGAVTAGSLGGQAAVGTGESGTKAVLENLEDDDPLLGNPNAPVTIVEFGDFQCPFCKRLFETTEQEVIEKYVKTGKAKLIYRDFPLSSIHAMAQKAAEASECADEQGKFWPYHDLLYGRQDRLSAENFKAWAKELGLNGAQFDACLDTGKFKDEVGNDFQAGQRAGISGTPATFVNGRIITGAVPFAQFEQIIEEELNKK